VHSGLVERFIIQFNTVTLGERRSEAQTIFYIQRHLNIEIHFHFIS